ncbi:hypothetical protein V8G54_021727 [Vigna mungo]|uniref:Uncharacterized protein n=1 Tax=Vigna mungo TaxID=3915 RepID=A0AAQ3NEP5_VIGMU
MACSSRNENMSRTCLFRLVWLTPNLPQHHFMHQFLLPVPVAPHYLHLLNTVNLWETHWSAPKRLLRYLAGTSTHGIHISASSPLVFPAYSDANWAGDTDDYVSTTGYILYHGRLHDHPPNLSTRHLLTLLLKCYGLGANPVSHSRMKHIALAYHFAREQVQKEDQHADLLTKPLPRIKFDYLMSKLHLFYRSSNLRGNVIDK